MAVANANVGSLPVETLAVVDGQADPAGATPVVAESEHPEAASATDPVNHTSGDMESNTLKAKVPEHKPEIDPEPAPFSPENNLPAKGVIKDYSAGHKKPPKNN